MYIIVLLLVFFCTQETRYQASLLTAVNGRKVQCIGWGCGISVQVSSHIVNMYQFVNYVWVHCFGGKGGGGIKVDISSTIH